MVRVTNTQGKPLYRILLFGTLDYHLQGGDEVVVVEAKQGDVSTVNRVPNDLEAVVGILIAALKKRALG